MAELETQSNHITMWVAQKIYLEVVEPLRELYKDEVRELARALEIKVAERQPFPVQSSLSPLVI